MAQPFDLDTRQLKGAAFPLAEHVSQEGSRYGGVSASENGTLVYAHGESQPRRLTGSIARAAPSPRWGTPLRTSSSSVALSPNEQRVALAQVTGKPANVDIWIIDLVRSGPSRRLTFDPGTDAAPVWSPDGTRIAFSGMRSGKTSLRQKLVDDMATDELVLEGPGNITTAVTGPRMVVTSRLKTARRATWTCGCCRCSAIASPIRWSEPSSTSPKRCSLRMDIGSRIERQSGERNLFVQPFPATGGKIQISSDGGANRSGERTARNCSTSDSMGR